jgi:hypothetical protein
VGSNKVIIFAHFFSAIIEDVDSRLGTVGLRLEFRIGSDIFDFIQLKVVKKCKEFSLMMQSLWRSRS